MFSFFHMKKKIFLRLVKRRPLRSKYPNYALLHVQEIFYVVYRN